MHGIFWEIPLSPAQTRPVTKHRQSVTLESGAADDANLSWGRALALPEPPPAVNCASESVNPEILHTDRTDPNSSFQHLPSMFGLLAFLRAFGGAPGAIAGVKSSQDSRLANALYAARRGLQLVVREPSRTPRCRHGFPPGGQLVYEFQRRGGTGHACAHGTRHRGADVQRVYFAICCEMIFVRGLRCVSVHQRCSCIIR
jgi:hypothetical protein